MDDTTTRPKPARTYGSRRTDSSTAASSSNDATANSGISLLERMAAARKRSPSPALSEATPSPKPLKKPKPTRSTIESDAEDDNAASDDDGAHDFFGWKKKMQAIDDGDEDDNLHNFIPRKSKTPASERGSPASTKRNGGGSTKGQPIEREESPVSPIPIRKVQATTSAAPAARGTNTPSPVRSVTRNPPSLPASPKSPPPARSRTTSPAPVLSRNHISATSIESPDEGDTQAREKAVPLAPIFDSDPEDGFAPHSDATSAKAKAKKGKVKKLSKKEQQEMHKESARLRAAQNVSIKSTSTSTWQKVARPMHGTISALNPLAFLSTSSSSSPFSASGASNGTKSNPSSSLPKSTHPAIPPSDDIENDPSSSPGSKTLLGVPSSGSATTVAADTDMDMDASFELDDAITSPAVPVTYSSSALSLKGKGSNPIQPLELVSGSKRGSAPSSSAPAFAKPKPVALEDSDDDADAVGGLMGPEALANEVKQKSDALKLKEQKQRFLREQQALAQARGPANDDDDDDDDLEIEGPVTAGTAATNAPKVSFLDRVTQSTSSGGRRPSLTSRHSTASSAGSAPPLGPRRQSVPSGFPSFPLASSSLAASTPSRPSKSTRKSLINSTPKSKTKDTAASLLAAHSAQASQLKKDKVEDYERRGGVIKNKSAKLEGKMLDELMKEAEEGRMAMEGRMDEVDGFVGGGDEDDDADDEDYAPGADTTTGAGGDDEAMASASSSEESESGAAAADADADDDDEDAEMDANTIGFSQSTSATTTLRDSTSLETVASASQPQPARRSDADDSDEEMVASQLVPPPRPNGRKTARKVIMDDSDDDGAQGTQEHDSDAENRPPPAFDMEGDSDAENVPPATQNTSFATTTTTTSFFSPSPSARGFDGVLRSPTPVIAGTSPRRTPVGSPASQAQDKRSPLRRLKSFSSLTFSSPPPPPAMHSHLRSLSSSPFKKFGEDTSSNLGAMFRAGTAGEKGVFGSPAVTETDGEKPDARGEDDFGLGGMSQLFGGDSQTQSTGEVAKTSQRSQALRRSNSFDLSTQPTLLPAIQISDARRKMNDDILIGQQLDGIGSPSPQAQRKSQGSTFKPKPPPTFNFESQTWALPGASSFPSTNPLSKSSFTSIPMLDIAIKSPGFLSPASKSRASSSFPSNPLDDDDEETEAGPSRRVRRGRASSKSSSPLQSPPRKNGRKRSTTPTDGARKGRSILDSGSESGTPPPLPHQQPKTVPKPRDAFSMLMSSKPGDSNKAKGKKPQVNREDVEAFMEQQAEESDEEIAFGFGVARRGGDDEDEEVAAEEEAGEDGHVKGLVDDQAMTDEQLAKEKVLEKVAEQHAEDEARRLKEAQDIADGQYRNGRRKRQRGLGDFDDSSDEEDETRRPKVEKKRKIKDDKMEGLAKLAKYNAFVNVYNNATRDEDDEYYENARSSSPIHALDDIYGRRQNTVDNANDDDAMDEDDVDDGASEGSVQKEEREIVTAAQLREEIRERAQKNKAEHDLDETPYDPTDLSWATKDFELEEDDMDDGAGFQTVQVVSSKPKPQVEPVNDEWTAMALEAESQREFPVTESQIRSYARNAVEYSNAGRKTAVTGGAGKPKPKPVASRGTVVREMKKATKNAVARSGSMLGRVTTRKQSSFMD